MEIPAQFCVEINNTTPGWAFRLDATRAEILIAMGEKVSGRKLLATALAGLEQLNVDDPEELARLRGLLSPN